MYYVFGSCFRTLAVILVSDFFPGNNDFLRKQSRPQKKIAQERGVATYTGFWEGRFELKNLIRICFNAGHTLGEFTRTRHRTEPTTVLRLLCCHLERENARDKTNYEERKATSQRCQCIIYDSGAMGKELVLTSVEQIFFLILFLN